MIYEIMREVETELAAQSVPFPVDYGPEPKASTTIVRDRIVFERDREGGDTIGPARSQQKNPRIDHVRSLACVCRIFAADTRSGARVHEHERKVDRVVDRVTIALRKTIAKRKTLWRVSSAKFLNARELELLGLETWPGVVYELRFEVDRGVLDTDWDSAARRVATVSTTSTTHGAEIASVTEITPPP